MLNSLGKMLMLSGMSLILLPIVIIAAILFLGILAILFVAFPPLFFIAIAVVVVLIVAFVVGAVSKKDSDEQPKEE